VPEIAVSLFIVLYITMMVPGVATQSSVFVALGGAIALVALTLSVAAAELAFRFTTDRPPLRLPAMAIGFFVGMYLAPVFVLGGPGWFFASIFLLTQAYVALFPGSESEVRAGLWIGMAFPSPAVLTIAGTLVLLPADPEPLLRRELAARLNAVAGA